MPVVRVPAPAAAYCMVLFALLVQGNGGVDLAAMVVGIAVVAAAVWVALAAAAAVA
jgi:hypothetical protein